jgi:hypothetical protein
LADEKVENRKSRVERREKGGAACETHEKIENRESRVERRGKGGVVFIGGRGYNAWFPI